MNKKKVNKIKNRGPAQVLSVSMGEKDLEAFEKDAAYVGLSKSEFFRMLYAKWRKSLTQTEEQC